MSDAMPRTRPGVPRGGLVLAGAAATVLLAPSATVAAALAEANAAPPWTARRRARAPRPHPVALVRAAA